MHIEGERIRLRAVEPTDIDRMYVWENDASVWAVSGTLVPFSRHTLQRFLEEQQYDLLQTRQQRLIIETRPSAVGDAPRAVGAADLFDLDMLHRRAGIGILIHAPEDRSRGYARDAVETLCRHGREVLGLHQLWCTVRADNAASLRLFEACGFERTGCKRDWLRTPEGWRDELLLQRML